MVDVIVFVEGQTEEQFIKRLENLLKYRKTRHGPLAAERVTLAVMERECVHFRGWLEKLRGLTVR